MATGGDKGARFYDGRSRLSHVSKIIQPTLRRSRHTPFDLELEKRVDSCIFPFFVVVVFQLANARAGQATSFGSVTSLLLQVASAKHFRNVDHTRG